MYFFLYLTLTEQTIETFTFIKITFQDKKADLVINSYVDDVMKLLLKELNLTCLQYDVKYDPTRKALLQSDQWKQEFTRIVS